MTDKERLERERDWVAERFNCTVESVFKEPVAVIESDIGSFNKLAGHDGCTANHIEDRKVTFKRTDRVSSISTDGIIIKVSLMHGHSRLSGFEIRPKWNDTEMYCDLFICDEKVSMHRASQKIVGDVLFLRG